MAQWVNTLFEPQCAARPELLTTYNGLGSSQGRGMVFTARALLSRYMPWSCVCLSVCVSVTSRSSTKMAKRRNTQTMPHDSPGTLVF